MDFDSKKSNNDANENVYNGPQPTDFMVFLPWACGQLLVEQRIIINRVKQEEYGTSLRGRSTRSKSKFKSRVDINSEQEENSTSNPEQATFEYSEDIVKIAAVFDACENLLQIRFEKNKILSYKVVKIIGFIIKYHPLLYMVLIKGKLDKYSIHEICRFLPFSKITDLCLDDTVLPEGNYYSILDQPSPLKRLSLARCSVSDDIIKEIALKLVFPMAASKTLSILNLSTNKITDDGAKHLAGALRSNRCLCYLNLSDNMITDKGDEAIFDTLLEFSLSYDEVLQGRQRRMTYFKGKMDIISKLFRESKKDHITSKKKTKNLPVRPVRKTKGLDKESSIKSFPESTRHIETLAMEKAEIAALEILGEFNDPFIEPNIDIRNNSLNCHGNNTLRYLNFAYNNLSFLSIKKLLNVLIYQKLLDRHPKGLINVSFEGNLMPKYCKEMTEIDNLIDMNLITQNRKVSVMKKKPQSQQITPRRN